LHLLVQALAALSIVAASFCDTLDGELRLACLSGGNGNSANTPIREIRPPGSAYVAALPKLDSLGDSQDAVTRSNLLVCENNNVLGPMHSAHPEIAKEGHGRYSHWINSLIFPSSDNTNPNTNGRTYSVVQPR
jgi:hypothetical protein